MEQLLNATERLISEQGVVRRIPVIKFCENTHICEAQEKNEKQAALLSTEFPTMAQDAHYQEQMQVDCSMIKPDVPSVKIEQHLSLSRCSVFDPGEATECPIIGSLQYDVAGTTVTLKEGKHICGSCQKSFSGRTAKQNCMKHIWGVHAGKAEFIFPFQSAITSP